MLAETAGEVGGDGVADRLAAVVEEALLGLALAALAAVEQVGGAVPDVTQGVDVEAELAVALFYHQAAHGLRTAKHLIRYAVAAQFALHQRVVAVAHLEHHCRVLGEEAVHQVSVEVVEVHAQAAMDVGESHLQQSGD